MKICTQSCTSLAILPQFQILHSSFLILFLFQCASFIGEAVELRYILNGYGMNPDTLPISWTGNVKVSHTGFLAMISILYMTGMLY